jgi:HK97 family phage portal protein
MSQEESEVYEEVIELKVPFLGRFFGGKIEKRSNFESLLLGNTCYKSNKSGVTITSENALQISTVYACVKVIAESMASLPCQFYKRENVGKSRANNHNLSEILQHLPNSETTAFDFWLMYVVNLILTGDAFAYIKRDSSGKIVELWNIPSANVTIYRNNVTNELFYEIKEEYGDNKYVLYSENIMHTRGMRFKKSDSSLDPITLAREAMGLNVALEEFGAKYFSNGANTGGIITYAGNMSDEGFDRFKNSFNEAYSGVVNSSKVLFLEDGATYQKVGNNPDESQSVESRKFQVVEIARFFNVPLHKIMDLEHATFSNIEQQDLGFVRDTLTPIAVRIEQTIFKDLLSVSERKKYFAKFNMNSLLRGDTETRKSFYESGIQNGYFSQNDVREFEDMNRIENGDMYMVNGNMITLEALKKGGSIYGVKNNDDGSTDEGTERGESDD